LSIILRDILKVVDSAREAKSIIKRGEILVDGRIRKDHNYPAGLMDVISIPKLKKYYRIVPIPNGLGLIEISEKESKSKICRIDNKTIVKQGRIQLNLHDGTNIFGDKDHKTGDSLLIEIPKLKIIKHEKLEGGKLGLIVKGKNSGKLVKIKKVIVTRTREPNKVVCEMDKEDIEAIRDYVLIVGKDKPLIKLSE